MAPPTMGNQDQSGTDSQGASSEVYALLRQRIISGEFAPAGPFSQVRLARELGVSRTPLRDALRRLESEGLIETEFNRRPRLAAVSASHLDDLYAQRIMIEALGIALTVRRATPEDDSELARLLDHMRALEKSRDIAAWEVPHQAFHQRLIGHAGDKILLRAVDLRDQGLRYRTRVLTEPLAWITGASEHQAIAEAFKQRDAPRAIECLALHYARTGLTVMTQMAPQHEAAGIRTALAITCRNAWAGVSIETG